MTITHEAHRERVEAGIGFEWDRVPERVSSLDGIPPDVTALSFHRARQSHRGIGNFRCLTDLWAYSVDTSFLEEICSISSLQRLYMEAVRATDLTCLRHLPRLERLVVVGATRVPDLHWTSDLPSIRVLGLENFKLVSSLEPLSSLRQLEAIGVEGSMWSPMRVRSLAPLRNLENLRWVFLTNLRVSDRSLDALRGLPLLRVLQCGDFYPPEEMRGLARANPQLHCDWFEKYGREKGDA